MITMDGGELSTIIKNMTPVLPSDLPPGVSQQQGFELEPPTKQLSTMIREKKKLILFKAKSLGYSAPEISTLAEEFDKRVMNIKKNIIKDELVSIPQGQRGTFFKRLESALQQGQSSSIARELPPEVFNALFSSEGEDQLELINMARTNWFDQLDNDNKVIAHRSNIRGHTKDKNTDNFNTGLMKFMFPKGNTDLEIEQDKSNGLTMMTEALSVFQQQGFTEEYGTFKTTFDKVTRTSTDNGVTGYNSMALYDNTDVVTRFQTDLANINPALSVADVQIAFNKNQITLETYIDLSGKYKTNLSNEDQAAIKLIKNKLDMSDNFYVDKEFLSTQKNKIYTATLAKYITDKAAAGNDFDPLKWVENNMPNVVRDVANANPIPGQVLHQAFQGKLNNQGKAYTLGGQTAFLTHYKNQTRGMLNRFIRKAIADGNTEMAERLQRDKEILDELVADPNFDSQQIPHYRLDDN